MICLGYLPFMWDSSKLLSTSVLLSVYPNNDTSQLFNEIMITWIFIVLTTLLDSVIKLPFSLYRYCLNVVTSSTITDNSFS